MKNGRIECSAPKGDTLLRLAITRISGRAECIAKRKKKFLFSEGYCQTRKYNFNYSQDNFTFCYYDRDHLGNIRQVTEARNSTICMA